MKLVSLPDCKSIHHFLEVGKDYEVRGTIGNGVIIAVYKQAKTIEDSFIQFLILKERFLDD